MTPKRCSIGGCENPVFQRGWCNRHYKRWKRHDDPLAGAAFRKRNPVSSCKSLGCTMPAVARGFCHKHWQRWRKRGTDFLPQEPGSQQAFLEAALQYEGNDCLIWPYSRVTGYASLGGKIVSRIVCERTHGPPPQGMEAAHLCGNGRLGCISKRHLEWATSQDNNLMKRHHGTLAVKLQEADIEEIRALRGKMLQREVAAKFGISQTHVSKIQRRASWAWLK